MRNELFYQEDVDLIREMKVAVGEDDFKVWKFNKSEGTLCVKAEGTLCVMQDNYKPISSIMLCKILLWHLLAL